MALGKYLGHAVELAHDALFSTSNRDGVMEDSIFCVVAITFVIGLGLVEAENVIDELLLLLRWLARCVGADGGFGGA